MHNLLVIPGVKLAAIGKEQPASRSMLRNHEKFPSVSRYTGPGVNADGGSKSTWSPALTVVSLSGISHATQPFDLSGDDQHGAPRHIPQKALR
jgi:hypothetical protein